jgi:diguanylate cyclase (GGDEF)-like protein
MHTGDLRNEFMAIVCPTGNELRGDQEIENVAERLSELRQEHQGWFACWAAIVCLGVVLLLHAASGLHPALLPLYVLPVWVATHFDGVRSGGIMVGLCTAAATFFHWKTGEAQGPAAIASSALLSAASFGLIMVVMAWMKLLMVHTHELASRDPLTGLLNRRALKELATRALGRALRMREPFIVVAIDCDGFKQLNDQYGHSAGDHVLRILAGVLEKNTRDSDLVSRTGGDEFVVMLRGTNIQDAKRVLRRVEEEFEHAVRMAGYGCSITMGMAVTEEDGSTIEQLIENADRAMYEGKESKKTRAYLN